MPAGRLSLLLWPLGLYARLRAARGDRPGTVDVACRIGVAYVPKAAVVSFVRRHPLRRQARQEVRHAGESAIRRQVSVGVHDHLLQPFRHAAIGETPWKRGRRESEASRELELSRTLAPGAPGGLHRD